MFNLFHPLVRTPILCNHKITEIVGSNMNWDFNTLEHGLQIKPKLYLQRQNSTMNLAFKQQSMSFETQLSNHISHSLKLVFQKKKHSSLKKRTRAFQKISPRSMWKHLLNNVPKTFHRKLHELKFTSFLLSSWGMNFRPTPWIS